MFAINITLLYSIITAIACICKRLSALLEKYNRFSIGTLHVHQPFDHDDHLDKKIAPRVWRPSIYSFIWKNNTRAEGYLSPCIVKNHRQSPHPAVKTLHSPVEYRHLRAVPDTLYPFLPIDFPVFSAVDNRYCLYMQAIVCAIRKIQQTGFC